MRLLVRMQRDLLSGVFNREETMARAYLESWGKGPETFSVSSSPLPSSTLVQSDRIHTSDLIMVNVEKEEMEEGERDG